MDPPVPCNKDPSRRLVQRCLESNRPFLVSRIGCFKLKVQIPVSWGEGVLETDRAIEVPQQQGWYSFSPYHCVNLMPTWSCQVFSLAQCPCASALRHCIVRYDGAKAGWVHSDCPDKRKGASSAEKNQTTCNANSRADSLCFVGTMQRPLVMVPKKAFRTLFLFSAPHIPALIWAVKTVIVMLAARCTEMIRTCIWLILLYNQQTEPAWSETLRIARDCCVDCSGRDDVTTCYNNWALDSRPKFAWDYDDNDTPIFFDVFPVKLFIYTVGGKGRTREKNLGFLKSLFYPTPIYTYLFAVSPFDHTACRQSSLSLLPIHCYLRNVLHFSTTGFGQAECLLKTAWMYDNVCHYVCFMLLSRIYRLI